MFIIFYEYMRDLDDRQIIIIGGSYVYAVLRFRLKAK